MRTINTANYNLFVTDDNSTLFSVWIANMAATADSNMTKIDVALKKLYDDKQNAINATGVLKRNADGVISAASMGTDYGNIYAIIAINQSPTWEISSEYSQYGYRGTIAIGNVTSDFIPDVVFADEQQKSGNYSGISKTYDGGVYIYSKVNDNITIPTIECRKVV